MPLTQHQLEIKKRWRDGRGKEWKKKNHKHIRVYDNRWRTECRRKALRKLGNKCANPACQWLNSNGERGCIDERCLQIDHVYGGGNTERKAGITGFTLWKAVMNDTEGKYQLLCANCNWIKKHDKKELSCQPMYPAYPDADPTAPKE